MDESEQKVWFWVGAEAVAKAAHAAGIKALVEMRRRLEGASTPCLRIAIEKQIEGAEVEIADLLGNWGDVKLDLEIAKDIWQRD